MMFEELDDFYSITRMEWEKEKLEWENEKEKLKGLIDPIYFYFAETHESYVSEGVVNIIEIPERTSGYSNHPHCRELDNNHLIYIKNTINLESKIPEFDNKELEYWVYQRVGHLGDDYSGYLLLPMYDGRYWKINYSC